MTPLSERDVVYLKALWNIFFAFARIGVCTFGGGYAMLPILQREIVQTRGWATEEELMDYYAIGQCTPGVIAVNAATFVGYKRDGVRGAIAATAGVVFPSLLIIITISAFIQQFALLPIVQHIFAGVRVVVCALVLHAVSGMVKKSVTDLPTALILLITFVAVAFANVSPIIAVVCSGAAGITIGVLRRRKS